MNVQPLTAANKALKASVLDAVEIAALYKAAKMVHESRVHAISPK